MSFFKSCLETFEFGSGSFSVHTLISMGLALTEQKAESIEFNIGSPKEWPAIWDSYKVDSGNYFQNSMLAYHAKQIWKLSLLGQPVDRYESIDVLM
jgi:hypothetical protein